MALNSGKILMRRGQEVNFDPNKMTPGEWAVSLDSKYVRMCFSPGVCVRMATYDAFEADMVQIQRILADCQTIEEAVERINDEISVKAQAVAEYASQAKQYRDEAEQFRNEAFFSTPEGYLDLVEQVGENTRKIAEGVGGVSSYNDLENKPKINDVVLEGEKTLDELGIASKEALEKTDSKVNIIIEQAELRFKETASGENIHLDDSADSKLVEFALYGKAMQDGMPTPQNPVEIEVAGESGSVEVKSVGKNLLIYPYHETTHTDNGITWTDNGDGTVTANGTATALSSFLCKVRISPNGLMLGNGTYILSGCPSGGSESTYLIGANVTVNGVNNKLGIDTDNGNTITVNGDDYYTDKANVGIYLEIKVGTTVSNLTFKPMIRLATDTDNTWEPYKGKTATIPTSNGLAGIPVDSGGNYTDQNGQQWICDEIVKYADGSGEYVQRIESVIADGTTNNGIVEYGYNNTKFYRFSVSLSKNGKHFTDNNKPIVSNKFVSIPWKDRSLVAINQVFDAFDINQINGSISEDVVNINGIIEYFKNNPTIFKYILAEPITTPLTAEQLAEIEKLSTFYPVTNISNDFDCGMKVKYIADAKRYVDNRIALIEQAMLNSI